MNTAVESVQDCSSSGDVCSRRRSCATSELYHGARLYARLRCVCWPTADRKVAVGPQGCAGLHRLALGIQPPGNLALQHKVAQGCTILHHHAPPSCLVEHAYTKIVTLPSAATCPPCAVIALELQWNFTRSLVPGHRNPAPSRCYSSAIYFVLNFDAKTAPTSLSVSLLIRVVI